MRKDGVNNDDPVENGIVSSPWFSLKVNEIEVPVYATRCGLGVHSFAWIDAAKSEETPLLEVFLTVQSAYKSVVVLPESAGVAAELSEKTVRATIEAYGSFSFVFDRKPEGALTLYVAPEEELNVPEDWKIERFSPGRYTREETTFSDSRTAYVFEAGRYEITSISVPSDSVVWFERGAYMEVYADGKGDYYGALRSAGTQNIRIAGRGLFDFSAVQGGDSKVKGVFSFSRVTNAEFSGVVSINSNNWSLCFTDSENVDISRCMLLGYRTFSDGIMLSDCRNSGAKHCFLRTGDDAVETKSTGRFWYGYDPLRRQRGVDGQSQRLRRHLRMQQRHEKRAIQELFGRFCAAHLVAHARRLCGADGQQQKRGVGKYLFRKYRGV